VTFPSRCKCDEEQLHVNLEHFQLLLRQLLEASHDSPHVRLEMSFAKMAN
jgi:hypothetical protein